MNTTEILALIGAAAWLPQILQWIYYIIQRPQPKLVSASNIQIGYDLNGPLIAITSSISTQKKDALITKITIRVIHDKGEERSFIWAWLDEIQTRIRTVTGETAEFSKNQPAIALQVNTVTPAEKFITFRDHEYAEKYQELLTTAMDHHDFLRLHEKDHIEALLKSKELTVFKDYYLGNMYWREGLYRLEVGLHEAHSKVIYREYLSFRLTKAEIETLKKNCELFEAGLRAAAARKDSEQEEDTSQIKYVHPKVRTLSRLFE